MAEEFNLQEIRMFTEVVRSSLNQHAPEAVLAVDTEAHLCLGVKTGYHGHFEFTDENGQFWSVSVEPSKRLR